LQNPRKISFRGLKPLVLRRLFVRAEALTPKAVGFCNSFYQLLRPATMLDVETPRTHANTGNDEADRSAWIGEFKENLACNFTAGDAWLEIEQAGLTDVAHSLLWDYAGAAKPYLEAMHRKAGHTDDALRAAARARQVAAERAANARAPLFQDRAEATLDQALRSSWPIADPGATTLGEELSRDTLAVDSPVKLEAARWALVKAAGPRSPINEMYFLFLLQGYTAQHGVQLGLPRLVGLANCAAPGRELDEGTLGRYLRKLPRKGAILRDTLPLLPLPNTSRP
jgi:hypothetical protein